MVFISQYRWIYTCLIFFVELFEYFYFWYHRLSFMCMQSFLNCSIIVRIFIKNSFWFIHLILAVFFTLQMRKKIKLMNIFVQTVNMAIIRIRIGFNYRSVCISSFLIMLSWIKFWSGTSINYSILVLAYIFNWNSVMSLHSSLINMWSNIGCLSISSLDDTRSYRLKSDQNLHALSSCQSFHLIKKIW